MNKNISTKSNNAPFVLRLEQLVRLMEQGKFVIEFNPCSDIGATVGTLIKDVGLRIERDGDVAMVTSDGQSVCTMGLTLANYKRIWRCWHKGVPNENMRRGLRWG